jgi:hypothetical protein
MLPAWLRLAAQSHASQEPLSAHTIHEAPANHCKFIEQAKYGPLQTCKVFGRKHVALQLSQKSRFASCDTH